MLASTGIRETKDFSRYSKRDVMSKSPKSSKIFIQPLTEREKQNPKFYSQTPNAPANAV